jgi:UDP-glucose 4-epimerase
LSGAVAIAGASGLIGHAIASRLESDGRRVLRIGRSADADVVTDLARAGASPPAALPACEALVHAAGVTDEDFADPPRAWAKAREGAATLLAMARACGVRRIAYISTAHVYGPLQGRIDEAAATRPASEYARAHLETETRLRAVSGDVSLLLARPCAVYGMPRSIERFARWSLIPFDFPRQAAGGRIVLRSAGLQRRNFVPADGLADLVAGWLESAAEGVTVANAPGESEMSVYDFAQLCARIASEETGRPCEVTRPEASGVEGEALQYRSRITGPVRGTPLEDHVRALLRVLLRKPRS